MQDWIEFSRAIVRPFIVIWGFIVYTVLIMSGQEVPTLLYGLVAAIILEYFGERAILKFKK